MDTRLFLDRIKRMDFFEDQMVDIVEVGHRDAVYRDVQGGLSDPVAAALGAKGIGSLYSHQADAIGHLRSGRSVVVVTGTASGKTLCYNIPVVESLHADPMATALYLFPTKALTQDQVRNLGMFQDKGTGVQFLAGAYDGDTPTALRRKLRDAGNIVLTNPDMLHSGLLPQHARWNRFFTHLRYVVVDEVHAYRGVFGSHLANLMRRLDRICRHYGSSPQFVCCSATIANPLEHAQAITGRDMVLVDNDGSPRGSKQFVFWNPPPIQGAAASSAQGPQWRTGGDRKSSLWEATHLMSNLVQEGIQTIAFVRTRLAAELLYKNCRDMLMPVSRRLAGSVHAYRGGYLPEERRAIERRLVGKELLGVASTNALELGIDIGSLDACILVGYPGSIASLWQQAGRAGRAHDAAAVFLVGQNSPIDQYLMLHSDYIFGKSPEQAVIDPDNPHVVVGHLKCAVHEMALPKEDVDTFGPYADVILELLEDEGTLKHIEGRWYFASTEYPAGTVNLRNISGVVYTIQDESDGCRVIGTLDEVSALAQLHDHAVYLHGADTYFVNRLDFQQKIAFVERRDLDYYTQSIQASQIRIDEKEEEEENRGLLVGFGDVTVITSIPMFKKIRFHSRDSLGFENLDLPVQTLETVAFWFAPPQGCVEGLRAMGKDVGEGLIGIANALVEVAPLYVMCDTQDIGAVVDSGCLGRDAIFVHDRYPGGMGFAQRCMARLGELLKTVDSVLRECACADGCPSCVGAAMPAFAQTDLDSTVRGRIPDKTAALILLQGILGAMDDGEGNPT